MKVFISWSGDASKQIALALREWLPRVIQSLDPFVSHVDIESGSYWSAAVAEQMRDSYVGVICLTPDNLRSTWIHFEAGALAKDMATGRACTYLFRLDPKDLTAPLNGFQATSATKEGTERLVADLNKFLAASKDPRDKPLLDKILADTFKLFWPLLEKKLEKVQPGAAKPPPRPTNEVLDDLLTLNHEIVQAMSRQTWNLGQLFEYLKQRSSMSFINDRDDRDLGRWAGPGLSGWGEIVPTKASGVAVVGGSADASVTKAPQGGTPGAPPENKGLEQDLDKEPGGG